MSAANAQLGNSLQHYRLVTITATTTGTRLRALLATASAKLPGGNLMKVVITPASAISIADEFNASYLSISAEKTIAARGLLDSLLIKCGSSTVSVVVELFYQEEFIPS